MAKKGKSNRFSQYDRDKLIIISYNSFLLPWRSKIDINENTAIMEYWNTGMMGDKK
jgi:hypothetical protein